MSANWPRVLTASIVLSVIIGFLLANFFQALPPLPLDDEEVPLYRPRVLECAIIIFVAFWVLRGLTLLWRKTGLTSFDDDSDYWKFDENESFFYILYSMVFVGKWVTWAIVGLALFPLILLCLLLMPLLGFYFGLAVGIWIGFTPTKKWFHFVERKLVKAKISGPLGIPYSWGFVALPILAVVSLFAGITLLFDDEFGLGRKQGAEFVHGWIELIKLFLPDSSFNHE